MRLVVLLAVLALVAGYSFKSHEIDGLDFHTFLKRVGVQYRPEELAKREELFKAELARVKKHNAAKKGWTETINKFSAMTVQEKMGMSMGYHKGVKKSHKKLFSSQQPPLKDLSALPANVDWRNAGIVTPVKDQVREFKHFLSFIGAL